MWLRVGCDINFEIETPTPFILMIRPRSGLLQWVSRESYILKPSVPVVEYTDSYGNLCQRLIAPPGDFSVYTSADIKTTDQIEVSPGAPFVEVNNLPDNVLTYLLPTRYCESDRFVEMGHDIVSGEIPGYDQVSAIEKWIRDNIHFNPDSIHFQLSAVEVNQQREGVCRELAHLGIALCRSISIPARMVVGYLYGLEPMDFHAWFEAYVGGRWHSFDPTQAHPKAGRVAVAYGRDAADVAIFTQFGPAVETQNISVRVEKLEKAPDND